MCNVLFFGKVSFRMLAKIFDAHPSLVYRWIVEASEKSPEQQIDDSITEIEFDETWHFIKSKKVKFGLFIYRKNIQKMRIEMDIVNPYKHNKRFLDFTTLIVKNL